MTTTILVITATVVVATKYVVTNLQFSIITIVEKPKVQINVWLK